MYDIFSILIVLGLIVGGFFIFRRAIAKPKDEESGFCPVRRRLEEEARPSQSSTGGISQQSHIKVLKPDPRHSSSRDLGDEYPYSIPRDVTYGAPDKDQSIGSGSSDRERRPISSRGELETHPVMDTMIAPYHLLHNNSEQEPPVDHSGHHQGHQTSQEGYGGGSVEHSPASHESGYGGGSVSHGDHSSSSYSSSDSSSSDSGGGDGGGGGGE